MASPEKTDHPRRRQEGSRREFKRCSRLFQRSPPPAIRICSQCLPGCQDRFQLIEANAREAGLRVFSLSDAGIAYSMGTTASIRIVSTAKSKMTRFAVFCHYRVDSSTKNLLILWKSKEKPVTTGSGHAQLSPLSVAAAAVRWPHLQQPHAVFHSVDEKLVGAVAQHDGIALDHTCRRLNSHHGCDDYFFLACRRIPL